MWFGVAPHLAINLLLGTSFIHRLIRTKFPLERKKVPWHSHQVAVLAYWRLSAAETTSLISHALNENTAHKATQHELTTTSARVQRQIAVPSNTSTQVLVNKTASKVLLIQPHSRRPSRWKTLAARGTMYILPSATFRVIVSSLPDELQHFLMERVTADTKPSPSTIYHCRQTTSNTITIEAPAERLYRSPSKKKVIL